MTDVSDLGAAGRVLETMHAGTAASTRRTYRSAVSGWRSYCTGQGWSATLDAAQTRRSEYLLHVLMYLQHLLDAGAQPRPSPRRLRR